MGTPPTVPPQEERFYNQDKLLRTFGIWSVLMMVATLWMVLDDFGRRWKGYQREFQQLKQKKYAEWIEAAKEEVDPEEIEGIRGEIQSAVEALKARTAEIEAKKSELDSVNTKKKIAVYRFQSEKGNWDVRRYQYEAKYGHYIAEGHLAETKVPAQKKALEKLQTEWKQVEEYSNAANELTQRFETLEEEIETEYEKKAELEKNLKTARGELGRLEQGLADSQFTVRKLIRSSPIIDLADPVFKIHQIVLPQIRRDLEFSHVATIDRCVTCHQAIAEPGFEDQPNPFKTHPKLDLVLGSRSPHPMNTIGCTTCHGGRGEAVDFTRAAHTPQNHEQAKLWKKQYGWHPEKHIPEKMLPLQYTEGTCVTCHKQTEYVPRGEKINHARQLVTAAGCYGCHPIAGFEHLRKPAPSLKKVKGKVSRDWMVRWVRDPQSFNKHARMPKQFHLSNMATPEFTAYQDAELYAVVDYLRKESEDYRPNVNLPLGNVERGKAVFGSVGCLGCHNMDDFPLDVTSRFGRAPDLSTVGSKVSRVWLTTWLKNPKHYWKGTTMPSLRLSNREISDVSAYLLTKKNAEFEGQPVGEANFEVQKTVLQKYLMRDPKLAPATEEKVNKVIAGMSPEELVHDLGRRAVGRYGCYGCHEVKGWEKVQGTGADLSEHGSKLVKKLDFGLQPLERTRHAWFFQKLKEPRIFDKGMVKGYLDSLRMPKFGFSDEEAHRLVLFLVGRTSQKIGPPAAKVLSAAEAKAEQAARVLHKYNCQGCHVVENLYQTLPDEHPDFDTHEEERFLLEGRILGHYLDDETLGPPKIMGEGARVLSSWLYRFMQKPTPLRRALKVRMPNFDLPQGELNTLIEGWANEGGVEFPYVKEQRVNLSAAQIRDGAKMFKALQCTNCHTAGQILSPAQYSEGSKGLAPDLLLGRKRLHKKWIVDWLRDPNKIQPNTRMPGFWANGTTMLPDILGGDAEAQMELMADYLIYLAQSRGY